MKRGGAGKGGEAEGERVRGRETLSESNGVRIPVDEGKHVHISRYIDDGYACAQKEEGERKYV